MTPRSAVYDTNVVIRYGRLLLATEFFLSAVVLQELAAGASDSADLRRLDRVRRDYESAGRFLVPNGEDWFFARKILHLLRRGPETRSAAGPPAISKEEQQRLVRDVLIARTARRVGALVVTENRSDFEKIRRYCAVQLVDPSEYLRRKR